MPKNMIHKKKLALIKKKVEEAGFEVGKDVVVDYKVKRTKEEDRVKKYVGKAVSPGLKKSLTGFNKHIDSDHTDIDGFIASYLKYKRAELEDYRRRIKISQLSGKSPKGLTKSYETTKRYVDYVTSSKYMIVAWMKRKNRFVGVGYERYIKNEAKRKAKSLAEHNKLQEQGIRLAKEQGIEINDTTVRKEVKEKLKKEEEEKGRKTIAEQANSLVQEEEFKNMNYVSWIEDNLEIINKDMEIVPFVLNDIQRKFLTVDTSDRQDAILKARQQGFSSLILALFTADFLLKPNTYNVVIADSSDNAQDLLGRVKFYIESWCLKNGLKSKEVLRYNSKYNLYFPLMNSTYRIGTARNLEFGRSKTLTNLHLSEGAFYPDLTKLLTGAMQAVVPTGRIIIETTANGFNQFKELWEKSKRGENMFKPHFYRASDFYSKEYLLEKEKQLGRMYKQEYPEADTESFITSGLPYFNPEALQSYLENVMPPINTGDIEGI